MQIYTDTNLRRRPAINPDEVNFAGEVQRLIDQLVKNHELCDQVCLGQYGVTSSQGYTILSLPQQGRLNMNELSEAMGIASSTMTRMVDQLVGKELVNRRHDEEDRRVVLVELTTKGQELRRTLEKAMQDFFTYAFGEIPEDERPAILKALTQVNKLIAKALKTCCTG